jgi:hypothetical protein
MSQRDLVAELRAARIAAPPELHDRVRLIASRDRTPSPRRFTWRRALVVALPVAAAIVAGVMLTRPSDRATEQPLAVHGERAATHHGSAALKAAPSITAPNPSTTRVQRYGASLTLRVPTGNGVSDAVKSALRITRSLGGYATSVHADSQGRTASASLRLRIPRAHVAGAVSRLSALGTITGEQVDIQDLQTAIDTTTRTIARLQRQLSELRARPRSDANDARIAALVTRVERLQRGEAATIRSARFATVDLHLTTPVVARHVGGHGPLHGLLVALTWLGIGVVYALALLTPVVLVSVLAALSLRWIRRRREDALLSRS